MKKTEGKSRFYDFGRFRLDVSERVLFEAGEPLKLPSKVFETLLTLVSRSGRIVERDELMNEVWKETFVEEANLSVNISALRKTLGKTEDGQDFIETVPRRGYRFRAKVSEYPGESGEDETFVIQRRLQARIVVTEIEDEIIPGRDDLKSLAANEPIRSLAVLPFRLLRAEAGDEYLSLSLADALITQFGNARRLIVRPTSAIKRYVDSEQSSLEMGRELQVDAVLECSIYRVEDRLRVTAMMLKTGSETSLWSDKFDIVFSDIFDVQDSIAEQVAQSLAIKLSTAQETAPARRPTESAEAYKLYLKGRYFLSKTDPESMRAAIEAFQQAAATDPEFAEAYAGLAETYIIASYIYLPHRQALPAAREAAEKALELNGTLAEAHNSLAAARWMYDWNWAGAERAFRRALALNPNLATAHRWYGLFLTWSGRFDEGIAKLKQAIELDPLSLFYNAYLGLALYFARRYDAAVEQCQKTLELDPNHMPSMGFIGLSYVEQGKLEAAISLFQKMRQMADTSLILSELGNAYARAGQRREACALLAELEARPATPPEYLALVYTGLGDKDQAFAWLDRAYEERTVMLPGIYVDPKYDSLRSDPRFADLLRRLGLAC